MHIASTISAGRRPHPLDLATLVKRIDAILLDFDGPICSAGLPAIEVSARLRKLLPGGGADVPPAAGPHELLTNASLKYSGAIVRQIEVPLSRLEIEAAASAVPTPGSIDVLASADPLPIRIVSNNTADAIRVYLQRFGLDRLVQHIEGRDPSEVRRMKPSPYLLEQAAANLRVPAGACVFVGDADTDVQASASAGMLSIGYANRPDKAARLTAAGADIVVAHMYSIAAERWIPCAAVDALWSRRLGARSGRVGRLELGSTPVGGMLRTPLASCQCAKAEANVGDHRKSRSAISESRVAEWRVLPGGEVSGGSVSWGRWRRW